MGALAEAPEALAGGGHEPRADRDDRLASGRCRHGERRDALAGRLDGDRDVMRPVAPAGQRRVVVEPVPGRAVGLRRQAGGEAEAAAGHSLQEGRGVSLLVEPERGGPGLRRDRDQDRAHGRSLQTTAS
jgi:hypothetical protein